MGKKQPESRLQRQIRSALECYWPKSWWFKVHGGPFQPAGIPDLIGCVQGRFIALEVKTETGEVSLIQSTTIERLKRAGGVSDVVTTPEQAIRLVFEGICPELDDARLPRWFWSQVYELDCGYKTLCWPWTGRLSGGYARMTDPDSKEAVSVVRWVWAQFAPPISVHLRPDHLCNTKSCVRPTHIEPVTHAENIRRGLTHRIGTRRK